MRIWIALAFSTVTAFAAGSPETAIVVVNGDSWASTWIANEYAAARSIPQRNILVIRDLPSFERIGVNDFREKILLPALKFAEGRGLSQSLDSVLYSADLPWAIDVSADMTGKTFPMQITQPASLTGLTYLYQFTIAKNPQYLGLNANFYFRQVSRVAPEAPWPEADKVRYEKALKSLQEITHRIESTNSKSDGDAKPKPASNSPERLSDDDRKQLGSVAEIMQSLLGAHPKTTELYYNIACVRARLGDGDAAIAALRKAMDHGWWDMRHAQKDPDLRSLWNRADFKALAADAGNVKFEMMPTSGFRGGVGWLPTGVPVRAPEGARYLLSTMLACTSGRGTSAGEAVAGLKRSASADGTKPKGTVYFMENGDVRSTTREWGFARATDKLREAGVNASIEQGVLPSGKGDVAGAMIGTADFDWAKSRSTITPGAIVEHLTSLGGVMNEGGGQTALTEFLRNGAAGSSGTVTEPYAIQAKFPSPFLHWHYAQGATLAEAYYQSVAGPYQLLIVGDAFCAPWKKRLVPSVVGAKSGQTLSGEISLQPHATSPDGLKAGLYELYIDGMRVGASKPEDPITVDTSKFTDGHHELSLIASATDALASTGRVAFPVTIKNADLAPALTTNAHGDCRWDVPIELTAAAPGAVSVSVSHFTDLVATIAGPNGTATIDPRVLGQGPITLTSVASYPDGRKAVAKPITFRVVPPPPLPAHSLPSDRTLAPGLHVIPSGLPAVVVDKADGDWLGSAGVRADGGFTVEAWFKVESTDVYQFQFHGPETLRVFIDGKPQDWPRGKEWWFIPVHLGTGMHKVRIEGKANGKPRLDARFGGPGAYKLAAPRFQHL